MFAGVAKIGLLPVGPMEIEPASAAPGNISVRQLAPPPDVSLRDLQPVSQANLTDIIVK